MAMSSLKTHKRFDRENGSGYTVSPQTVFLGRALIVFETLNRHKIIITVDVCLVGTLGCVWLALVLKKVFISFIFILPYLYTENLFI